MSKISNPEAGETPILTLVHSRHRVSEVWVDGRRVPMSPLERQLLGILSRRSGVVVLRDDLMELLAVNRNVLKALIWRLRQRLPRPECLSSRGSRSPRCRHTPDGAGYALLELEIHWSEIAPEAVYPSFTKPYGNG